MGKLIMWNVITLDGYFEGPQSWDLSFHSTVFGEELEQLSIEQLTSAASLVFGRKTYDGMAAYWTTAKDEGDVTALMNSIPKIVCTNTLKTADWNNTTILNGDVSKEISKLKRQSEKDIYVFGSADLSETLIKDNVFDEYRICVAPVIAGAGRYLFPKELGMKKLTLISSQGLKTGGVIMKYAAIN